MGRFPETNFGRCDESGHLGPDYPEGSSNLRTDADAVHGSTGAGYKLVEYQGRLICPACKRRLENEAQSLQAAKEHAEGERFRANAGFSRVIPDNE